MSQQLVSDGAVGLKDPEPVGKGRGVWPGNPMTALWRTTVGKKAVMAVTGAILVGFVVAHMAGNLKIFLGAEGFNAYALFLRTVGEPLFPYSVLLWAARSVLLISAVLHIVAAVELTRINRAARPRSYAVKRSRATTVAAITMRWSGVLLAVFIVYHLLHLTLGAVGFPAGTFSHESVYRNVVTGFSIWYVSAFYILAMGGLCLHLDHGIWSMLETLGLNNIRISRGLRLLSRAVAFLVFLGFIAVPIAVLAGWLA
jgi:succinate dehydrogenase / fumarate reductase, cytochrome b subunit